MSSNDLISITWKDNHYEITHEDADGGYIIGKIQKAKTIKEAVIKAKEIQDEEMPEYGIFISTLEEK